MADWVFRIGGKKWKVPAAAKFDMSIFSQGTKVTLYDLKDKCFMGCDADGKVFVNDGAHYEIREVKLENFQSSTAARKVLPINVWWEMNKKKLIAQKPSDPKAFLTFRSQKWKDLPEVEKKKYEKIAAMKNDPDLKGEDIPHELSEEEDATLTHPPPPTPAPEKKRKEKEKSKDSRPAKKQKVDTAPKPQASAKLPAPKRQLTLPQKKAPAQAPTAVHDDAGDDSDDFE
eukprot:GGOE01018236.1.p1 GENE.GGOE01018236.1~~GGOE01018236.1.p1  ORF type:complete len:229 (-),score=73.39 GGOE01018236.1:168-854(-)